jgi:outer membrane immunogenic protein
MRNLIQSAATRLTAIQPITARRIAVLRVVLWTARLGLLLGCSSLFLVMGNAQGAPAAEVGADFNYVRANAPPDGCGCFSMYGGNAWFAYNFTRSFALVAEVGSQRASDISGLGEDFTLTSYLFGPRYSWRRSSHFVPFAQVLLGGVHAGGSFPSNGSGFAGSSNAFALIAGGGLDIGIARHFAIRAFEADYYRTQFANGVNDRQNNLRLGAGVIFRFGER